VSDPFSVFGEWSSEADQELMPGSDAAVISLFGCCYAAVISAAVSYE
jgi:hypothetical protein